MKIAQEVLEVLDRAEVEGKTLKLTGQLDRKLYQDVNKVLEAIGGKWSKGAKAHVFDDLVVDVLDPIMETGEYSRTKQDFGQFDSPPDVVARVIQLAGIEPGMTVLEPSAGIGNIAYAAEAAGGIVTAIEVDPKRCEKLRGTANVTAHHHDFLQQTPVPFYDRVVMNPPFAKQADIDHVLHAAKCLKPGGRLVAVMSASVMFRENRKTADFRAFVEARGGSFEKLPESSFSASGTQVNTCIVAFDA
jgi:protein-L-isoaspartate O-methyltransferase